MFNFQYRVLKGSSLTITLGSVAILGLAAILKTGLITNNVNTCRIPRIGGPFSTMVDLASNNLEKVGAETALLSGSFLRKALKVWLKTIEESVKTLKK